MDILVVTYMVRYIGTFLGVSHSAQVVSNIIPIFSVHWPHLTRDHERSIQTIIDNICLVAKLSDEPISGLSYKARIVLLVH